MSVCLSVRPSVCPSVHVFTFEVSFKRLFAPTFWSRMSNIFKDSESLGKSNGKKWSQIWSFLFGSGLKLLQKKVCFLLILPYKTWWKSCFPMDYRPLAQLYGCSRPCSRPVLAQRSMGFGPNPLINGLIQHTFKLNILFLEKFTVIHFD